MSDIMLVTTGKKSFGKTASDVIELSGKLTLTNTKEAVESAIKARSLRHAGTSVADSAKGLISFIMTIDQTIITALPDTSNPVNWLINGQSVEIVDSDNLAKRADLTAEKIIRSMLVSAKVIEPSARGLSESEKVTREIDKLTKRAAAQQVKADARATKLAKQMQELKDKQSKAEKESALRLAALKNPGTVPQNSADIARANGAKNRHTK